MLGLVPGIISIFRARPTPSGLPSTKPNRILMFKSFLFRSAVVKAGKMTIRSLRRNDSPDMVKRRAKETGISERICNYIFRAIGITAYLEISSVIEKAQQIAAHESPKITKL